MFVHLFCVSNPRTAQTQSITEVCSQLSINRQSSYTLPRPCPCCSHPSDITSHQPSRVPIPIYFSTSRLLTGHKNHSPLYTSRPTVPILEVTLLPPHYNPTPATKVVSECTKPIPDTTSPLHQQLKSGAFSSVRWPHYQAPPAFLFKTHHDIFPKFVNNI